MKIFPTTILLLLITYTADGQQITAFTGIGTYAMGDLRDLNDEFQAEASLVALKPVANFDPYIFFGLSASFPLIEKISLGFEASLHSTGSRLTYSDYSGALYLDQKIHAVNISALTTIKLLESGSNSVTFDPQLGLSFSQLSIQNTLKLGTNTESDVLNFNAVNIFGEPGFQYIRWFTKNNSVGVGLQVGYYVTLLKGKLFFEDSKELFLTLDGDDANANWSGIRARINLAFRIP